MKPRWPQAVFIVGCFMAIAAAVILASPPGAFFSSDEGVKYVQLTSLLANRFTESSIRWPGAAAGYDVKYAAAARFIEPVGAELFSPHPVIFAAMSAPGRLLLGFKGIYFWPLWGGAASIFLTALLAWRFGSPRPWLAAAITAAATPVLFYSVTYWEHTAAVALWLAGWAVAAPRRLIRAIVAGALWGGAAALRPEALWLAAWSAGVWAWGERGRRFATVLAVGAGVAGSFLGMEFLGWGAFSQPPFLRFASNFRYGALPHPGEYLYALNHSLLPILPWYLGLGVALVLGAVLASRWWGGAKYVAAGAGIVLTGLYFRYYAGFATALLPSFPAVFIFCLPRNRALGMFAPIPREERGLYLAGGGFAATLFAVVADTSGYSWGPRFLLFIFPVLCLALARYAGEVWEGKGVAPKVFLILFLTAAVVAQTLGLYRLWGTRAEHGAAVRDLEKTGDVPVMVNKWYLPLYAAAIYDRRSFFIVNDERDISSLADGFRLDGYRRAVFWGELPVPPGEAEDYELGMTNLLTRSFEVVDCRGAGKADRRFTPPLRLWELGVTPGDSKETR